jgi:hypothetical protein
MRPQSTATAPARCPLCVLGAVRVLLSKGHVGPAERVLEELPAAINLALASVARRAYGEGIEEGLLARPCQGRQKPARGRSAAGRTLRHRARAGSAPGPPHGPGKGHRHERWWMAAARRARGPGPGLCPGPGAGRAGRLGTAAAVQGHAVLLRRPESAVPKRERGHYEERIC